MLVHLAILALVILAVDSPIEPKSKPSKQVQTLQSYLLLLPTPPKTPNIAVVPDEPAVSDIQNELKQASNPAVESDTQAATPKVVERGPTPVNHQTQESVSAATDTQESSQSKAHTDSPANARQQLNRIKAATSRLLNDPPDATGNWQQYQEGQALTLWRARAARPKQYTEKFAPEGSNIEEFGVSADGSRLIQLSGNCFNVKQDEFGDNLWTPTPCPQSANPFGQALQHSLEKYGVGGR